MRGNRVLRHALVVGLVTSLLVTGCSASHGTTPPAPITAPTPSPGALSLLTEPDQGIEPIYALLRSARHSIDLTMYELVDPQIVELLESAANHGIVVRVILDTNREKTANQPAHDALAAHGAHVVWADARYAATHEKAIVVDKSLAAVMSLNLTSRYYDDTRDFAVLDRQQADVFAIEQVFDADFRHAKVPAPLGRDLVWSPGAEPTIVELIRETSSSLLVENEEMALSAVTSALIDAERRGVHVTVVMTRQDSWASDFDKLSRAGVVVRTYSPTASLYIHAKAIVADPGTPRQRAFVGSQNFSAASLQHNRELGLLAADPSLVASLASTIRSDAAGAEPWPQ
ncbi:MAG: phospholipase D-like domain-containing protein [Acidothermaceae bacterium]